MPPLPYADFSKSPVSSPPTQVTPDLIDSFTIKKYVYIVNSISLLFMISFVIMQIRCRLFRSRTLAWDDCAQFTYLSILVYQGYQLITCRPKCTRSSK